MPCGSISAMPTRRAARAFRDRLIARLDADAALLPTIRTIGDVTCDIAPVSSVPSTLRASSIEDPVYGYDPQTGQEVKPYQPGVIDVMAIDNLPSELPRDAATAFGAALLEYVLPDLLQDNPSPMIERATITRDGQLTPRFAYLQDYVAD